MNLVVQCQNVSTRGTNLRDMWQPVDVIPLQPEPQQGIRGEREGGRERGGDPLLVCHTTLFLSLSVCLCFGRVLKVNASSDGGARI